VQRRRGAAPDPIEELGREMSVGAEGELQRDARVVELALQRGHARADPVGVVLVQPG